MSLYALPDEMWCRILNLAFRDIETEIETLKAAFTVRATSYRFLQCIDLYLFGDRIRSLEIPRSECIPSISIPLFTSVSKLSQSYLPQMNDETLRRMPWIKELRIRNEKYSGCDTVLTERGLTGLTRLEVLSIHEPNRNQVLSMSKMTNLGTLDLWFNKSVRDTELPVLDSLTGLHLYEDRMIEGVCFSENKMPRLNTLIIGGRSILASKHMDYLVPQLEVLGLWDSCIILPTTLERMTNLKELTLVRTRVDYSEAIRSLTSLHKMVLNCVYLSDDTFTHLTQLSSLELSHMNDITPKSLTHLTDSLTKLCVSCCSDILPSDFSCFTQLKKFSYYSRILPPMEAFDVLVGRGVERIDSNNVW